MTSQAATQGEIVRDLGNGLILRRGAPGDADVLAEFNADIHRDPGRVKPDEGVAVWTRELLSGQHPTFAPSDFTIVEDTATGAIVSSLCLIDQTWAYAGIEFGVGRPELVGTHPEYRNRGLVRAQFEVVHEWSAARGQMVQAITGIPWYYRQFGYEMAVNLGGGRSGFTAQVPKLREGEADPYRVRAASDQDIPLIARLYAQAGARSLLQVSRDDQRWRYEIGGRSPRNVNRRAVCVIETEAGDPVGILLHSTQLWNKRPAATRAEVLPGISWLDVAPSVVRYLEVTGASYAALDGEECTGYTFALGIEHPIYQAIPSLLPHIYPPYAWYLRVPDLRGFLCHIAPILEQRLARSVAAGYTGEMTISFYRSGLKLALESGRLKAAEPWTPTPGVEDNCHFPGLSFLQLVFGYRSLEELRFAFPDCTVDGDRPAALLNALFPKMASHLWPID